MPNGNIVNLDTVKVIDLTHNAKNDDGGGKENVQIDGFIDVERQRKRTKRFFLGGS